MAAGKTLKPTCKYLGIQVKKSIQQQEDNTNQGFYREKMSKQKGNKIQKSCSKNIFYMLQVNGSMYN